MSLSLVSLNIERSKHLGVILPFLKSLNPDILCLQELMEYDVPVVETELEMGYSYTPLTEHEAEGNAGRMGIGIFSRLPISERTVHYYRGGAEHVPTHISMEGKVTEEEKGRSVSGAVALATIMKNDEPFRVATVHFTWTANGNASDLQRADMRSLLRILDEKEKDFVLCGDFNAPRGGEIFSMLTKHYKDNVPLHYTTSIDHLLHRAGPLQLMVDGLFSTPGYAVGEVTLRSGLSDHCALMAVISKL